jgi:hypothetical protein
MSLDESNIQDLVDQVTQFQDDLEEKTTQLDTAMAGLEEFLSTETEPKDYKESLKLFQYNIKNQKSWFKHTVVFDSHLMHIYPVVEKLVENLFINTRSSVRASSTPMQNQTPQPNENPNQQPVMPQPTQPSALEKLKGVFGGKKSIEEELDPWQGNYDLMQEAKAYPKTWRTMKRLHSANIIRAKKFPSLASQQNTRDIELYYLTSRVEPSIATMVERSRTILRDNDTERVARILGMYYQAKEKHRLDMPMPPPS